MNKLNKIFFGLTCGLSLSTIPCFISSCQPTVDSNKDFELVAEERNLHIENDSFCAQVKLKLKQTEKKIVMDQISCAIDYDKTQVKSVDYELVQGEDQPYYDVHIRFTKEFTTLIFANLQINYHYDESHNGAEKYIFKNIEIFPAKARTIYHFQAQDQYFYKENVGTEISLTSQDEHLQDLKIRLIADSGLSSQAVSDEVIFFESYDYAGTYFSNGNIKFSPEIVTKDMFVSIVISQKVSNQYVDKAFISDVKLIHSA